MKDAYRERTGSVKEAYSDRTATVKEDSYTEPQSPVTTTPIYGSRVLQNRGMISTDDPDAEDIYQEFVGLIEQIIQYLRSGRAVKNEGLGTWSLNIGLDGRFDVQYRADAALIRALNVPGTFTGTVRNRGNIGKNGAEIVKKWNDEHPTDPVPPADV